MVGEPTNQHLQPQAFSKHQGHRFPQEHSTDLNRSGDEIGIELKDLGIRKVAGTFRCESVATNWTVLFRAKREANSNTRYYKRTICINL